MINLASFTPVSRYLVEVQLPHQRAGEGVVAVHRHDDGAGVGGAEQRRQGLQQAGGEAGGRDDDVALPGTHQLLGQRLLQGVGQLAGRRAARPAGVRLQGEDLAEENTSAEENIKKNYK